MGILYGTEIYVNSDTTVCQITSFLINIKIYPKSLLLNIKSDKLQYAKRSADLEPREVPGRTQEGHG